MDAVWKKLRNCVDIGLGEADICVLVNYDLSYSDFSEYIKTKPALLKLPRKLKNTTLKIK
jgi:hypothetical protein